jgi:hypothetical protein
VDLIVELAYKRLNIVDVEDRSQELKGCSDGGRVVQRVDERSEDELSAILPFFGVSFEKFLFDVAILGLLGSKEVEETYNHKVESF